MAARLEAGLTLGSFVLDTRLALGGMAEIWSAREAKGGRVALKILHPDLAGDASFVAMFRDELRIAAEVQHPNLLGLQGAHEAEGHLFASMDLIGGLDVRRILSQLIQRGERFSVPAAVRVVEYVAKGLHHAHTLTDAQGQPREIVHRDVSPHNIMISRSGEVFLLDFGIARAADRVARTRQGVVKGKASYMAPEQAMGVAVSPQTDIFSLGIVLWEMLAMRRLFVADSDPETVELVLAARVPEVRTINPAVIRPLGELVHQMLAQRGTERPASAAKVALRCQEILAEHFPPGSADASVLSALADPKKRKAKPSEPTSLREDTEPTSLPDPGTDSGALALAESPTLATEVPSFTPDLATEDIGSSQASGPHEISDSADVTEALQQISLEEEATDSGESFAPDPSEPGTPTPDSLTPDSLTPDSLTPDSLTPDASTPGSSGPDKVRRPTRSEILMAVEQQQTVPIHVPDELVEAPAVSFEASQTVIDGEEEATEDIRDERPTVAHAAPTDDLGLEDPASRPVPVPATVALPEEPAQRLGLSSVEVGPRPTQRQPSSGRWVQIGLPVVTLGLAVVVLVLIFLLIRG